MSNEFNFKVKFHKQNPDNRIWESGWSVYLPHQCDSWDIAGSNWTPATKDEAVKGLETFISEAQEALAALKEGRTHNLEDMDKDWDEEKYV